MLPLIAAAAPAAIQAGMGIVSAIRQGRKAKQRESQLESAVNNMPEYEESPLIRQMYAQAQAQQNAVNPAIAAMYRQAQQGAANTAAIAQRNATSGAEAIQAAANAQAQLQAMSPQIAQMQTQYNMANLQNLNNAQERLAQEGMNVYRSQLAKNDALQGLRAGQLGRASSLWDNALKNTMSGISGVGNALASGLGKGGGAGLNTGGTVSGESFGLSPETLSMMYRYGGSNR